MAETRKHIRLALPADKLEAFEAAKRKAEDTAKIKLTDGQFASKLIQWALEQE